MPIYEYKGQQYEMTTEDPAAAKAKILGYLEKQGASVEEKPAPAERKLGFSSALAKDDSFSSMLSRDNSGIRAPITAEDYLKIKKEKEQSVLEKTPLPPVAPTEDRAVLNPKFTNAVEAQLNAMPAEERAAAVAKLAERPNVYGRAAKAIAGRYQAYDKNVSPTLSKFDPRLEAQKQRFMEQGRSEQQAEIDAMGQSTGNIRPDFQQMRPDIVGEKAAAEAAARAKELEDASFTERVGAGVRSQVTKSGLGLLNAYADLTGDEQFGKDLVGARRIEEAREGAIPQGKSIFEKSAQGAMTSLASQAPLMALSAVTGTAAPILAQAAIQQFGDSYGEGRAAGLSGAAAATRAISMATAEVFFERFGMTKALAGLKAHIAKYGVNSIPKYVAQSIATEVPSEQATTITDYLIDIAPKIGLNKNPSLAGLYSQMEETLRQTVLQAGVTAGGTIAVAKGAQKAGEALSKIGAPREGAYERDTSYEGLSELIARQKGFFAPQDQEQRQQQQVQQEQAPPPPAPADLGALGETRPGEDLQQAPPPAPPATPVAQPIAPEAREAKIAQLATEIADTQGIPDEDARSMAEARITAQEQKQKRETAALATKPQEDKIKIRAQELLSEGYAQSAPEALEVAKVQIQQEDEADALAEDEAKGETNVGQPNGAPSGAGAQVASATNKEPTATGVGGGERPRMVPTKPDATSADGRETPKPAAVKPLPVAQPGEAAMPVQDGERKPVPMSVLTTPEALERVRTVLSTDRPIEDLQVAARRGGLATWEINAILGNHGMPNQMNVQMETGERYGPPIPVSTSGAAVKGKRGPKGPRLTPEEKQKKAEADKVNEALIGRARRALTSATKLFEELPKQLAEGKTNDAAAREDITIALVKLLKNQQELRAAGLAGSAEGKRIKKFLEANSREVAAVQASLAAQEENLTAQESGEEPGEEGTGVSSSTINKEPADERISKFTTGAQALTHVIKTGSPFQARLAKRLRSSIQGVKFVVLEKGQEVPDQLKTPRNAKAWDRSIALYIENYKTNERVIYVRGASFGNSQGINNTTILHELLHAATNRKLAIAFEYIKKGMYLNTPAVRAAQDLIRTMNSAASTYEDLAKQNKLPMTMVALRYDGDIFNDPREFVSYGLTDPEMQKFLMQAHGYEEDVSFFTQFVQALRNLFGMADSDTNALTDLIIATDNILKAKVPKTKLTGQSVSSMVGDGFDEEETKGVEEAVRSQKAIEREAKIVAEKFNESVKGYEFGKAATALQMAQDPRKVIPALRSLLKRANGAQRKALVALPTTEFLADWAGSDVPQLKNISNLLQRMNGMTLQLLKSAGELTSEVERAFRADNTLRAKMDKIAFMSTLMELDPSDPNAKERSLQLDKMYAELGKDGQRVFKRIKNHFEVLSEYMSRLLDDQITNSKLPIAEQANLMKKIRAIYETGAKISPYFPLVREGDYWLSIGSGQTRKFFMYDSAAQRDEAMQQFADERVKKKPNETAEEFEQRRADNLEELITDEEYNFGNDISTLRRASGNTSVLLRDIFAAIDGGSLGDSDAKERLKDTVYQVYLQSMPEQSFRRQFIHRKGTTGFRPDLLRNVAHTSTKMATQLARIKYAPLLRNALSAAQDSIANRPNMQPFVTQMQSRVDSSLSPVKEGVAASIVGGINKASYIYYLGGASSALLQPLSIFQTGLPVLSRYGAFNATRELGRMLKVWQQYGAYKTNKDGTQSWVAPSIEHAKDLTPLERKAIREMLARDVTTSTYASAVFDYKKTPTENLSSPITKFGKGTVDLLVLGGLMHSTERLSREVMFLSSFRLNIQEGKTFEEAVDQATYDTNEALGNYGEYNRPTLMKGLGGKLLTQFMMYPLHVTLFLLKNFKEMIKPMDGRTRAEAVQKFFGTLGTTYILGGYVALPMFSTIMGLLGWAWEALKDKDWPEDLRSMSFELWFRNVWMPQQLGETEIGGQKLSAILERGPVNALTGLDISGRTSLNNLWLRDSKEAKTVKEEIMNLMLEKSGAGVNMMVSMAEGLSALSHGDTAKGMKKLLPAGFRNYATAYEYYKEGAKDNKGTQILSRDAFTTGQIIGQAVGFRSDLLANTQYVNFKVIGIQQRILNERQELLNHLDRDFRDRNVKKFTASMKEVNEFNRKFPTFEIDGETISNALEGNAEKRAKAFRGFELNEKNVSLLAPALMPSRKAARAAEEKGREK